jgi:hypothetical protein
VQTYQASCQYREEVQKVGLQVYFVVYRGDAVDAGGSIPAGQPIGPQHPIQIDDVVELAQRRSPVSSSPNRPSIVGGWTGLRGPESPLMCQVNDSLLVAPPFPPPGQA